MARERWRRCRSFHGYTVSDRGAVCRMTGEPKAANMIGNRLAVKVTHGGRQFTAGVAALALDAFSGPRPRGWFAFNLDGDPRNCAIGNLEWKSPADRGRCLAEQGRTTHGERNGAAKLKCTSILGVRLRLEEGQAQRTIAKRFGVDETTISKIANRRTWKVVQGCLPKLRA